MRWSPQLDAEGHRPLTRTATGQAAVTTIYTDPYIGSRHLILYLLRVKPFTKAMSLDQ